MSSQELSFCKNIFQPVVSTPATSKSVIFNEGSPIIHTFPNHTINQMSEPDEDMFPSVANGKEFSESESNKKCNFTKPKKVLKSFLSPNSSHRGDEINWSKKLRTESNKIKENPNESSLDMTENLYSDSSLNLYSTNDSLPCLPGKVAHGTFDNMSENNFTNRKFHRPKPKLEEFIRKTRKDSSKPINTEKNTYPDFLMCGDVIKYMSNNKGEVSKEEALTASKQIVQDNEDENEDKMSESSYRFPQFTWVNLIELRNK